MVEKTKVLITGSKGMLGSSLVETLSSVSEVNAVRNTISSGASKISNGVKGIDIQDCDITKQAETIKAIKDFYPSAIVHTAAYTDVDGSELNPERAFAVNAKGTENVACAAEELDATLFFISTDYVFDGNKDKPYTETDIPNPINIYGRSKLEAERIIQAHLEKYFILRTSWLFGPNGKNFVTAILQEARENKTLKVVNDQIGSPTYTLDLAKAIKVLLSAGLYPHTKGFGRGVYGIYHITNSGSCSWYEFAGKVISLKQLKTQILPITTLESKRPAQRPKMSVLDNSKLMTNFLLKLRFWQDALHRFLFNYT